MRTRKEPRITGLSLWGAAAVLIPKVSNFEQQFPFHSFRKRRLFASEDGGSHVARYCGRSPQRIRGPCRTLPENGEDCIEPRRPCHSTPVGSRMAKTSGCSSAPS